MIAHPYWLVSGLVSVLLGLAALGFNILKECKLEKQRSILQMIVGVFGAWSLYKSFLYSNSCACSLGDMVWFITGFATFCVGLAGVGFNIIKVCKLEKARVALQYIAGIAGIYSLADYFHLLS